MVLLKHLFLYTGVIRGTQLMPGWKLCFYYCCNTLTTFLENCKESDKEK